VPTEDRHVGHAERGHVPHRIVVEVLEQWLEAALVPVLEALPHTLGVRDGLHADSLWVDFPGV
jgi:hypothetical protein